MLTGHKYRNTYGGYQFKIWISGRYQNSDAIGGYLWSNGVHGSP